MLNLNGVDMPSFVKVNKVTFSILPSIKNNTLSVRGRKGVFLYGQEMTERRITAEVTIVAEEVNNVMAKTRELAAWLYQTKEVKLIISDEPDKYYKVVPDGETDIDEVMTTGRGNITFLCTDAVAYGKERTISFTSQADAIKTIFVEGTDETFPQIELKVNKDIDSVAVVADDGYILIGEPAEVTKKVTNPFPRVWLDNMENISNWTEGVAVDDGAVYGSMTSTNGYGVSQTNKDYGTGSQWHGASKIRSLVTPIQDFEVQSLINMKPSSVNQIGRIEMYLLDANGKHIGKVGLADLTGTLNTPLLHARAGDYNSGDGYQFAKKSTDKKFDKFYGRMTIGRKGKKWYAKWQVKSGETYTHTYQVSWMDTSLKFQQKLAGVQIHLGQYSNKPVVNDMQFTQVSVYQYVELSNSQAPIIAEAGDILLIDSANSLLYKNGRVFYEGINPSSTFFSLRAGVNAISVTDSMPVTVKYTERWL